jgi:transposase
VEDKRRRSDKTFKEGAVRMVRETGLPMAEVARRLEVHPGTLRLWVHADRRARGQERSQAARGDLKARVDELERENAELRVERDVLKRSVVLWVKEATGGR